MATKDFEKLEEREEREKENRFAHVLQPIRDITKNWNIDIAAELEEYLHEVEQLTFSFDGGATQLNFAEAALLIQGSACIYSRKVEYLYTLVYETLDRLARKGKERDLLKSSLVRDGDDVEADLDVSIFADEPDFLDLNDIKPAKNIDMVETYDPAAKDATLHMRTPAALLRMDGDGEYLVDVKGEKIGSRRDFKLNTMLIHATNALVDPNEYTRIDLTFNAAKTNVSLLDSFAYGAHNMTGISLANMTHLSAADATAAGPAIEEHIAADGGQSSDDEVDIDMGGGGDFDMGDADAVGLHGNDLGDEGREVPQTRASRHAHAERQGAVEVERALVPTWDPWAPLDPHDDGGRKPKPFRKGKPYRIPAQIKAIRKGEEVTVTNTEPIGEFLDSFSDDPARKLPKNWLVAPIYPENAEMYFEYHKHQQQQLAEIKARMVRDAQLAAESEMDRTMRVNEIERVFDDNQDIDFDDGHGDGFDLGGGDSDDDMDMDDIAPLDLGALTQQAPATYEDMDLFLASAEKYADHSQLAVRVRAWEERIRPILEAEEQHDPFDIHEYGNVLLDTGFDKHQEQDVVPFEEIAGNKEPYEICRLFLATLQLANQGNVEIVCENDMAKKNGRKAVDESQPAAGAPGVLRLKLLSREKVYDFDNYLAPSVTDAHAKKAKRRHPEAYGENAPLPIQ